MKTVCPHCNKPIEVTITKIVEKREEKKENGFKFTKNPLDKLEYTQKFGTRPDFYARWDMIGHNGVDFRTKSKDNLEGRVNVYAVMDGVVIKAIRGDKGGYGKYVKLKHADGGETTYGHFYSLNVVINQKVKAGDILGISDSTGASSGPHLHFGYRPSKMDYNNGYKGSVDQEPYFI